MSGAVSLYPSFCQEKCSGNLFSSLLRELAQLGLCSVQRGCRRH